MSDTYLLNKLNKQDNLNPVSQPIPNNNFGNNSNFNQNMQLPDKMDIKENKNLEIIKKEVTESLTELMAKTKEEVDGNFLKTTIMNLLLKYNHITIDDKQELLTQILYDIEGYGVLQPLLDDEQITEIIVCKYDNVLVEKFGKMMKANVRFQNEKDLRKLIDKIVQPLGRRIDDSQPMVNARLKDKSRVNIVIPPLSPDGATVDIRKFPKNRFTTEVYLKNGTMSKEMAEFIKWIVTGRKSTMVSGGTGSGKTTLLNYASNFVPENEVIVTIEDLLELQLVQPSVRRLEARAKNAEGTGEVTIRDCLINALRMRPDRIVVGECRSVEVIDMLQAMNTGHDGSLSTAHSNSPKDLINRLYVMYLMGGLDVPERAVKSQIASALDIIIQIQRLSDGSRKITQISEVIGLGKEGAEINNAFVEKYNLDTKFHIKNASATEVYLQDIFKYDEVSNKFVTTGWIPTFLDEFKAKGYPLTESMFKGGD